LCAMVWNFRDWSSLQRVDGLVPGPFARTRV
jgi:hypothetical protein